MLLFSQTDIVGMGCVLCLLIELSWGPARQTKAVSGESRNRSGLDPRMACDVTPFPPKSLDLGCACVKNKGPWLAGTALLSVDLNITAIFNCVSGFAKRGALNSYTDTLLNINAKHKKPFMLSESLALCQLAHYELIFMPLLMTAPCFDCKYQNKRGETDIQLD